MLTSIAAVVPPEFVPVLSCAFDPYLVFWTVLLSVSSIPLPVMALYLTWVWGYWIMSAAAHLELLSVFVQLHPINRVTFSGESSIFGFYSCVCLIPCDVSENSFSISNYNHKASELTPRPSSQSYSVAVEGLKVPVFPPVTWNRLSDWNHFGLNKISQENLLYSGLWPGRFWGAFSTTKCWDWKTAFYLALSFVTKHWSAVGMDYSCSKTHLQLGGAHSVTEVHMAISYYIFTLLQVW